MKRFIFTLIIFCFGGYSFSQNQNIESTKNDYNQINLKRDYLGQSLPSDSAVLFAPGIVSTGLHNRDVTISPDGTEIYFGTSNSNFQYYAILYSKQIDGIWTKPEVASFSRDARYTYVEPMFSLDGNKLYFVSNMPRNNEIQPTDNDIWVVEKQGDKWGKPKNVGAPINTDGGEYFPSFTLDGTMYFNRKVKGGKVDYIYKSKLVKGKYTEPEKLPKEVNCGKDRYNAFVAKDESFVIVPAVGVEENIQGGQYYIVFKDENNYWKPPINMGPKINGKNGNGWSISLSPDGKYIFFMSRKALPNDKQPKELNFEFLQKISSMPQNGTYDIYWIDARVIDELKQ